MRSTYNHVGKPHHQGGTKHDDGGDRSIHKGDSCNKQQVHTNGVVLEQVRLGELANIARGVVEHEAAERDECQPDELNEIVKDEKTAKRQPGEPVATLANIRLANLWDELVKRAVTKSLLSGSASFAKIVSNDSCLLTPSMSSRTTW